jgi:small multidrug resistance pump
MKVWIFLLIAILFEVTASLSMSAAQREPLLYAVTIVGYSVSFWLLGKILKMGMPIAIAYGIWGSLGVVLTAGLSVVLFNDPISMLSALGIAVIVLGIVIIQIGDAKKQKYSLNPELK